MPGDKKRRNKKREDTMINNNLKMRRDGRVVVPSGKERARISSPPFLFNNSKFKYLEVFYNE